MFYPGLFNSSYIPSPQELFFINTTSNQLGPPLIGLLLTTVLQGVLIYQYYEYIDRPGDVKAWTKWLIHSVFGFCLIKFLYVWCIGWDRFVYHYGNWAYISTFNRLSIPLGLSNAIPNSACQLFYIHRYWVFSRNAYFTTAAIVAISATLITGFVMTYAACLVAGNDLSVSRLIFASTISFLTGSLLCNVFVTGFVCHHLIGEKTGYARTDNLVKSVIRISLEAAVGPTALSLLGLLLVSLSNGNQWFLVPAFLSCHVYSCSLFYSVNARKRLTVLMSTTVFTTVGPALPCSEERILSGHHGGMSSLHFQSRPSALISSMSS